METSDALDLMITHPLPPLTSRVAVGSQNGLTRMG
jgi:hypothetical protein